MQRILCLLSGMNAGGAETFLMKMYRCMDRQAVQLDFCINVPEPCFYEEEIKRLGGRIFRIPSKSENVKEFKCQLTDLVRREGYTHVLRITSNGAGFLDLKVAKKAGARVCIARSSNSRDEGGWKAALIHRLGRLLYGRYVDVALAPSDLAAIYTFGKRAFQKGRVTVLHNGVDLSVFHYDEEARHLLRESLHLPPDTTVYGHIGRFSEQKNHPFLLKIFHSIVKTDPTAVLLLVGDGPLKQAVESRAAALGLSDRVHFLGIRSDVPALLSAMDVFLFPSLYEGMPNTVIEAQATGLPCVVADTITKTADITGLLTYLPLAESPAHWAAVAVQQAKRVRADTKESFVKAKYDIHSTLEEFLLRIV